MSDEDRVAVILGEWCDRCEQGESIKPEEVIGAHPELAEALRDGFAALDAVDRFLGEHSPHEPIVPDAIGPYGVIRRLGAGGMGTVYLAEDEAGAHVALKVIHPQLLERPGFFKRFLREAQLGRQVEHENVVRTLDVDAVRTGVETVHYLVMEYVKGRTLRTLLDDLRVVPEALLREIAKQATSGLSAIHQAGIVHRDLKPENILITDEHRVQIMDLGVARSVAASVVLTREGQFAGSLRYAAPEQFKRDAAGPAADLYALGILLFELATGEHPFPANDAAAVMQAHLDQAPPRTSDRNPDVSAFFAEVVATLLRKEPSHRFESAAALRDVLTEGEQCSWWMEREREVLTAARSRPRVPVRRETALHGRESDLDLLRCLWADATKGRGNALLLEGEAGIGKSRLVDAFLGGFGEEEATVLYGSYPPSGGLGGLSDALLEHFGAAELKEAIAPYLQVTPRLVPALAALLRHETLPEDGPSLAGDALHTVFVNLMHALSEERPLLWIIEDLHFARTDSRRVLSSLARAVAGRRILLLLTTRPELPDSELALFSRVEAFRRKRLGRLSAREVILLLEDAFQSQALAEKLGGRIALKSDGVPFFVFEMIRGLREGQFITQLPDGSYVETRVVEDIQVPSAIRDLIAVRLQDLDRDDRAILDVGAVQGFEFGPDLVAEVLERQPIPVLQALADLERRSGVVRARGSRYVFDHHQIQEMVYSDLPEGLREAYHTRLAEVVTERVRAPTPTPDAIPGDHAHFLAHHHLRGARPHEAEPHVVPALQHLERCYRHEAAVELADQALAVPSLLTEQRRLDVLLGRGRQLFDLGRVGEEEENHRESLRIAEVAEDATCSSVAHRCLGNCLLRQGRLEEAERHYEIALRLARKARRENEEAKALSDYSKVLFRRGRYEEADQRLSEALRVHRSAADQKAEVVALLNLGLVWKHQGRHEEARGANEDVIAIAHEIGELKWEAAATINLGSVLHESSVSDDVREWYERGLRLAQECGNRLWEANVTSNLGGLWADRGHLVKAGRLLERGLVLYRELGDPGGEATALVSLSRASLLLGRSEEAGEYAKRADTLAQEAGESALLVEARFALAAFFEAMGKDSSAERVYEEVREISQRDGKPGQLAVAWIGTGRIRARAGDCNAAETHLHEAITCSVEQGLPSLEVLARCLLSTLPGGDPAPALAALAEHAEQMRHEDAMSARFPLWRATRDITHLTEAKRLLDHLVEHAPAEHRESMLKNVRINREIMEVWEANQ